MPATATSLNLFSFPGTQPCLFLRLHTSLRGLPRDWRYYFLGQTFSSKVRAKILKEHKIQNKTQHTEQDHTGATYPASPFHHERITRHFFPLPVLHL